jgi:hypothetical protein
MRWMISKSLKHSDNVLSPASFIKSIRDPDAFGSLTIQCFASKKHTRDRQISSAILTLLNQFRKTGIELSFGCQLPGQHLNKVFGTSCKHTSRTDGATLSVEEIGAPDCCITKRSIQMSMKLCLG